MWVNKCKPTKQIVQIKNGHYSPELWNRLCVLKTNKQKTPTNNLGVQAGGISNTEILFTTLSSRKTVIYTNFIICFSLLIISIPLLPIVFIFVVFSFSLSQGPSFFSWTQEKSLRTAMGQCPYRQLNRALPLWQMYLKRNKKRSRKKHLYK